MKRRADELLVERALVGSRTKARALILAGEVWSAERRVEKAGERLAADAPLEIRQRRRFVSRGGDKLEGALEALSLDVRGLTCVDLGASTGGFTDCVLQRGAARVYAVDVGRGQLAQKLCLDARVVVMDGRNARELCAADFPEPIELGLVDASFIGVEKLLPALARLLPEGARLLVLVKPQFEAGRVAVSRGRGVIRDPEVREAAIEKAKRAIREAGFELLGESDSVLPGPKGNLERFVLARNQKTSTQTS